MPAFSSVVGRPKYGRPCYLFMGGVSMFRVRAFLRNESGISGIVVAAALIVIGVLGCYWLYSGIKPGIQHTATSIGQVMQQQ